MITIKQQAELAFHHVDVKDAVIMAEFMNQLSKCITEENARKLKNELPDDTKQLYRNIYADAVCINSNEAEKIFNVLSAIGFVATEEYSAEDILAKHLKKD